MGLFTSFQLRSQDAETRGRAARSLGVKGKRSAIASLTPLVEDDVWSVRQAAAEALGAIGDPAAVPSLLRAIEVADAVRDRTGADAVRAAAVDGLGRLGTDAVPALVQALQNRHARTREGVIVALGTIGGPEALAALSAAVGDDRSAVRQAGVTALARAGGAEAVPLLAAALSHKDPTTRRASAAALGTVADEAATAALAPALADRDRSVRDAVVHALAAQGRNEAAEALADAVLLGDRELRAAAATALGSVHWTPRTAEQRVVHAVIARRYDEAAAEGHVAVDLLVATLGDRDADVRRAVLVALGRIGDARASAPVAALLRDPDAAVRDAAVDALAGIGPAAAAALVEPLGDRTASIRAAADCALERIGPGRAVHAMLDELAVGRVTPHGAISLRVVETREDLDRACRAVDRLEALLTHAGHRLPADALARIADAADVILLEPGRAPGHGERLDLEGLRRAARARR